MSDQLRGRWVRDNRIFRHDTRREMLNVHLYCYSAACCANEGERHNVPIDVAPFSRAIMTGRPHPRCTWNLINATAPWGRGVRCCPRTDGYMTSSGNILGNAH